MPRKRPRPHVTTYDLTRRRSPLRALWLALAALLGLVVAFAGMAAVSRAMTPHTPSDEPSPAVSASVTPSAASVTPSPPITAPQDQVDELQIEATATRFVDAWLQRDRAKRKSQLESSATKELTAALMKTDDQNIPRTTREGSATIDSRADGVAIVLQSLADASVLRITLVQNDSARWLVTSVDEAAA